MVYLNEVHLRGIVGSVRETSILGRSSYRFSLCTDYCYRSKDGDVVIETTWHDLSYLSKQGECLDWLKKGAAVEALGRIRVESYATPSGERRSITSVCVNSIEQVKED